MPTEHLGHFHNGGARLDHTPIFKGIIALLRWAVEQLASMSCVYRVVP